MSQAGAPEPPGFHARIDELAQRLTLLPDKPQETAEATLKVLWWLAAGEPMSVERAEERAGLLELDSAGAARLDALIARRLGISVHTAKFHVAAILQKLGAVNRTDAIAIAMREGLVLV